MNCLLIAATPKEIAPFLQQYRKPGNTLHHVMDLDVLITGIGLTSTVYQLTKHFSIKRPGLVVQAGVAGCFDKNISLGSVVVVKKDTIADESVIELKKLKTLFDLKLVPQNKFPYKQGWLVNPATALISKTRLIAVKSTSVNQITTSKEMIQFYKNKFDPVTESMEGAALHYTCLMEKIPFLQVRSISNYIGERNKKNWNMTESILNLNNKLIKMFSEGVL